MQNLILYKAQDAVAHITLNRPERHNSLVPELLDQLLEALTRAEADSSVAAVVLSAHGRSFSTGGDVAGFIAHWDAVEAYSRRIVGALNDVVLTMMGLRVPVVAAVQGWVTGGSLGLVLGADLVLLAEDARFAPYYSEVGFSPDGGWTAILPDRIGARAAAEIQYLNRALPADEAVRLGLANRVVANDRLAAEAEAVARRIAGMVGPSVASTKRLLAADLPRYRERLTAELEAFVARILAPEQRALAQAFIDRTQAARR